MFYIPQIQKDDCGFACLKMLLATINKDREYLFIPQKENHGLYSYEDLIEEAYYHHVTLYAFRTSEKMSLSNCESFPFIACIGLKNGAKHAVLVLKCKWKRVVYLDPARGKVNVSLSKFISIWDGTGLMIESFEKRKCEKNFLEPLKTEVKVILSIIQFLSGIAAVLGVMFIRDDIPGYVPIICLGVAISLEVLMKILSFKIMKRIDDYFFKEEVVPKSGFKDYFCRFEEYKKLCLSSPMNFILTLVFSLGLVVVVIFNDYRNLMIIGAPIILSLTEALLIGPVLKNKKQPIEQLEDSIDDSESPEDFRGRVKALHIEAYRYGYVDIFTRYVYALIIVLAVYFTMKICEINSFPYIIFYSCISLTLYKSLANLLHFEERVNKLNIVKVKLSNYINSIQ